ncbi:hypothetical protein BaRGS_00007280 [Batillaria attramentaria]|uniref:Secreted protein n=1 Tax=Batillaria attramentaria TaxID=370345 RepID=A0ABD0LPR0_9CAEN
MCNHNKTSSSCFHGWLLFRLFPSPPFCSCNCDPAVSTELGANQIPNAMKEERHHTVIFPWCFLEVLLLPTCSLTSRCTSAKGQVVKPKAAGNGPCFSELYRLL